MNTKDVYVVRHAESVANAGGRTANVQDIGLTENGMIQAKNLVNDFPKKPDIIIISPYIRTRLTAEPLIHKYNVKDVIEMPVQEFTYLDSVTHSNTTREERVHARDVYWKKADPYYNDGDAESFYEFMKRVEDYLAEMRDSERRSIVTFTHEYFIKGLQTIGLHGRKIDEYSKDEQKSLMRFFYNSAFKVKNAEIHHLADLGHIM